MQEIWKDIDGFDGYQVSNTGKVKSLNYNHTGKERILKASINTYGYKIVNLFRYGKKKNMYIHQLVARAFIPNPDNLPQVNHKDEDKTNNNVSNLEWCDGKYNCNFGTRNERVAKAHTGVYNTKKSKSVRCVETGVIFPSANEVQRQLGFVKGNICKCCNGKQYKTVGGYHWEWT